jgi:hypothetical protein
MELLKNQITFAQNVAYLIMHINELGYGCTFGETFRSKEQAEIYAKQCKGIVDSLHCKRLAVDLNLFNSNGEYLVDYESYHTLGNYWKTLNVNNRWGGDFKNLVDSNHFEMQDL